MKRRRIEGYRTTDIEFEIGEGDHSIYLDGELHSTLIQGETTIDSYTGCLSSYSIETSFNCSLTGMIPNQEHNIVVNDSTGTIYEINAVSSVEDILPEPGGTSGVLFAIGSIILFDCPAFIRCMEGQKEDFFQGGPLLHSASIDGFSSSNILSRILRILPLSNRCKPNQIGR